MQDEYFAYLQEQRQLDLEAEQRRADLAISLKVGSRCDGFLILMCSATPAKGK